MPRQSRIEHPGAIYQPPSFKDIPLAGRIGKIKLLL